MKTQKVSTIIMFFILLAASLMAQTLWNNVGHIPFAYQEQWNRAGLLRDMSAVEPKSVINFAVLTGTNYQKIQTALNQARSHVQNTGGLAIIYFPMGTYDFTQSIEVLPNDSNIVFQGEGSDKTNLRWKSACTAFKIYGTEDGNWIDLSQNFDKGDSVMYNSSSNFSSFNPGEWIQFAQNHFSPAGGDAAADAVGQITQIETVDNPGGNWIEIKDMANRDYTYSSNSYYNTRLRKINPVCNIGIEDLTISRFYHGVAIDIIYNIDFSYAVNCWVRGIDSDFTQRHHLSASRSSHIEITGCYFHEAAQYSGGGYGDGVCLIVSTTNSLVENNIFKTLRHAMIAGEGSNCNVWTFNYSTDQKWEFSSSPWDDPTNRDLDLHAKYPFGHLFEHNIVEKIGSHAASGHGENGPYNTFVRNKATKDIARLEEMEDWSTLGNIWETNNLLDALPHDGDYGPVVDVYGFMYNYTVPVTHNICYNFGYVASCLLDDVSYYYSSKPEFLDGYTWPAIGPETRTSGGLSYSIAAYDRFGYSKKTYLPAPTPHSYYLSGTYSQNLTLKDNVYITSDVTIASGYTLTLKPGTIVRANANTRITVNGTLKAEGTASQKITFTRSGTTGTWYGIRFENSSVDANCIVKYCDIQYASYGVYCTNASPKIENNTFSNNTYAIYMYYSSPSIKNNIATNDIVHCDNSSPYMENNRITSSAQTYPLYIYGANAAPQLFHNTITGDMLYGVYAYNSCAPRFGSNTDTTSGHNRIEHNGGDFSIFAQNYAQPFLGSTYVCAYRRGGNNAVVGNNFSCKVYANNNSRVDAEYTWWGQYPPPSGWFYATGNSVINYANSRSTDPGGGSSLSKAFAGPNPGMPIITESESPDPADCDSLWRAAENLRLADASTKAAANAMYQTLIAQFPYAVKAHHSLIRIVHLMNSTDLNGLRTYLSSLIDAKTHPEELKAVAKDVLTCCYNQADDYKNAIQTAEQILQQYPKSEHEYTALFNLFNIYQKDLADESAAKKTWNF